MISGVKLSVVVPQAIGISLRNTPRHIFPEADDLSLSIQFFFVRTIGAAQPPLSNSLFPYTYNFCKLMIDLISY